MVMVRIHRLPHGKGLVLPSYATPHSAGMDIRAGLPESEVWLIEPGLSRLIPTGMVMAIPAGYEGQVRPRSGLALRHQVTVLNAPGTIDADYRGEVAVVLINHGSAPFEVRRGDRIAQLVIAPVSACEWAESELDDLGQTERGEGGYGSTGKA
jgi:dUTP pyrophosphatase